MARKRRLAAMSSYPDPADCPAGPADAADRMVEFWDQALTPVLQQRPDLVVLPETCDRWPQHDADQQRAFFAAKGDRMEQMLCAKADASGCYIAYPTYDYRTEAVYNIIAYIAPKQGVIARYRKCVPTLSEQHERGIVPGAEMRVVATPIGRIGGAICFDLNFDPLMQACRRAGPEVIVFPSMYHGGFWRQTWAYGCRCYLVGAIARLPSYIISPLGQVIAESTNYHPYVIADVNLDYCVLHLDENWGKLEQIRAHYGPAVQLHDPGFLGAVMLTAEADDVSIAEVIKRFKLELLDDYLGRSWQAREARLSEVIRPLDVASTG